MKKECTTQYNVHRATRGAACGRAWYAPMLGKRLRTLEPAEDARLFDRLDPPQPLGTQLGERVDDDTEDKVHGHSVDKDEEQEVKGHPPCVVPRVGVVALGGREGLAHPIPEDVVQAQNRPSAPTISTWQERASWREHPPQFSDATWKATTTQGMMVGSELKIHVPREPKNCRGHKTLAEARAVLPFLVPQVGPEVPVRDQQNRRSEIIGAR